MWFVQAGGLGPPPHVFPLEGESVGIQRTLSFCLKVAYEGGQALDAGLGVLHSGWVLPRCPSSPFPPVFPGARREAGGVPGRGTVGARLQSLLFLLTQQISWDGV